jgi:hypothetical protein
VSGRAGPDGEARTGRGSGREASAGGLTGRMPLPVGMVEAGVRPADSGRDGGCGLTGGSAGQPADRRTGLAHPPADGTGAEAWAGEPGAGPGGLPWPAGRPVRSAVALACLPVRPAMVDRRVHHVHGEAILGG